MSVPSGYPNVISYSIVVEIKKGVIKKPSELQHDIMYNILDLFTHESLSIFKFVSHDQKI